ncbi:hypothetical protein [Paenibacillus stellifer]|uniref:hypothetical protein n=1 Tax=Paenibacillus stellifer TaxID=169760 RepID=UPI00068AA431|nr:hypothetical protein [Paenibacillus stellifer]
MIKATVKKTVAVKKPSASRAKAVAPRRRRRIRQTLDRFVVIATNLNSVPRDTSGWTAELSRNNTTITADFDDFGVARFTSISTLTTVSYILRIRDDNGTVLTTRTVPANREVYVARF